MSPYPSSGCGNKNYSSGSPIMVKQGLNLKPGSPTTPTDKVDTVPCSSSFKKVTTPKSGSPFKAMKKDKRSPGMDFNEYTQLSQRLTKSMYYAKKMPSVSRPSFPLTVLAVNAFTSTNLGTKLDTLEFLDLELASEIGINACVSPTTLIMTLVYLERLHSNNPAYLKSIKPSELFVISLLVASKFIQDDGEDCGIYNDEWAASAGMETKDVNKLEIEFLTAIDWNVNISKEEFEKGLQNLECRLAQQEGEKRGTFTYTELEKLSKAILTWNLMWPIVYDYAIKVIVAASITYATLATTLLTSSFVAPSMVQYLSRSLTTASQNQTTSQALGSLSGVSGYAPMTATTFDNKDGLTTEEILKDVLLQVPDLDNLTIAVMYNNYNFTNAFRFSNGKPFFNLESQEHNFRLQSMAPSPTTRSLRFTSLDFNRATKLSFYEARLQYQLTNYQNRFCARTLYNSCSAKSSTAMKSNYHMDNENKDAQRVNSFAQFVSL